MRCDKWKRGPISHNAEPHAGIMKRSRLYPWFTLAAVPLPFSSAPSRRSLIYLASVSSCNLYRCITSVGGGGGLTDKNRRHGALVLHAAGHSSRHGLGIIRRPLSRPGGVHLYCPSPCQGRKYCLSVKGAWEGAWPVSHYASDSSHRWWILQFFSALTF